MPAVGIEAIVCQPRIGAHQSILRPNVQVVVDAPVCLAHLPSRVEETLHRHKRILLPLMHSSSSPCGALSQLVLPLSQDRWTSACRSVVACVGLNKLFIEADAGLQL